MDTGDEGREHDTSNGVGVGAISGAALGAFLTAVTMSAMAWSIPVLAALGGMLGYWWGHRRMRSELIGDPDATAPAGLLGRFGSLAARVGPRAFVWVVSLAVAILLLLGILQRYRHPGWDLANLDAERSVAKWFAAGLSWAAAGYWFLASATGRSRSRWTRIWWPALAWLAIDDGNAIHERLERWSGIDWQLLYLPILGIAGLAGLGVLLHHRSDRTVLRLMLAGGAAWAIALLLELFQNWGGPPIDWTFYSPMMIAEEIIEMIGSALFVIAGLLVLRAPPGSVETDRSQREHFTETQ